uniref:Plexin-B3 n=1 Tax=Ornithorhynchus anatinus TaxID=9258 RepID=F6Q5G2_ORNAN
FYSLAMLARSHLRCPLLLLPLLFLLPVRPGLGRARRFSDPSTSFNHLVQDRQTGTLYVGAVNRLYQLRPDLELEEEVPTGPVMDSPECLPFKDQADCPQASLTDNSNKLLLVRERKGELIVCGQVCQGTCEKRSLANVSHVLYRSEDPGDYQFVAANDARVSTVGLVGQSQGRELLFVGRGLTAKLSGGIPPITIRQLEEPNAFSYEGLGRLVVGDFSDYNNSFVGIFVRGKYVYFLFFRRGSKAQHLEYRTYISRICLNDTNLYSYVEVPLECQRDGAHRYDLAQAAHLAQLTPEGTATLLVAFAAGLAPSAAPPADTALCAFSLDEVDARMQEARRFCYTTKGRGPDGSERAAIEYGVMSYCSILPMDSPDSYPCGEEHTPSPIVSRQPLKAEPLLMNIPHLTAVAAVAEAGHVVVLLGDAQGQLHKVFLNGSEGQVYSSVPVGPPGSPVNPDLLVDVNGSHVYVMTTDQVDKVPISDCPAFRDCDACLQARDPFCGWCVLEGRCTRKSECEYSEQPEKWLWSYGSESHCPAVLRVTPTNCTREKETQVSRDRGGPGQVTLVVPRLPSLDPEEYFHCTFGDHESLAIVKGPEVSCSSPSGDQMPANEPGKDHVTVALTVMFNDVVVAATNFTFYDCAAIPELAVASPCSQCVSSPWQCHWCLRTSRCVSGEGCPDGERTIYNQDVRLQNRGPGACPRIEGLEGSSLVAVDWLAQLTLRARNLQNYQVREAGGQTGRQTGGSGAKLGAHPLSIRLSLHPSLPLQFGFSLPQKELQVPIYVTRGADAQRIDDTGDLHVTLYDCTVGHEDCSHCQAANKNYDCVWCGLGTPSCLYRSLCHPDAIESLCPTPIIRLIEPLTGPPEGGTPLTIVGTNLGRRFEEVAAKVTVAGQPCHPDPDQYLISTRIVCFVPPAAKGTTGPVEVAVDGHPSPGISAQNFTYQDPVLQSLSPWRGLQAGGTRLTIHGQFLQTGSNISAFVGDLPCHIQEPICPETIICLTSPSPTVAEQSVRVLFGLAERLLTTDLFHYFENPKLLKAEPFVSFLGGGRLIKVNGTLLDMVEQPRFSVWLEEGGDSQRRRRSCGEAEEQTSAPTRPCSKLESGLLECSEPCAINSSQLLVCPSPAVPSERARLVRAFFVLDNLRVNFSDVSGEEFRYADNPRLQRLNRDGAARPYHLKPGNVLDVEGKGLNVGISKEEVRVQIGDGVCTVKTLTSTHLYCEPPLQPPQPLNSSSRLPEFIVQMGNLRLDLGRVQYDTEAALSPFPAEAQMGLGVGAAVLVSIVLLVILMYRRKSKQAMRDYKKVLVQLENLETSVGDQCRREFTDLMMEMTDLSSDLEGTGIPFLDYKTFTERAFFPGHTGSPLRGSLDVPEGRRPTVEQGLTQLSNLLNHKPFLIKLIHTLEKQPTFSQRDRCHVASLLSLALHGKLEYLTDIMKTLLGDLTSQYVSKNPKLMLRRTETVAEKLLTNWMSISLYSFLREVAGEPLYMLFRAIKYQVDKGPVDAVTGKAKRTLNDSRLLREDIEFSPLTLTVLVKDSGNSREAQRVPVRVLNTDTITQVKEKVLDQIYKGTPFSQRPPVNSLDLEWRSGLAGHLTLSDEDLTSVTHNQWKRLNTLQHYKVPDGATVGLIPRLHNDVSQGKSQSFLSGEDTPMLEDGEEGGIQLWHLVKSTEEPEVPKQRRSSLRERERAKAIPEIYLTRLLSMKGTLQKFVDDTFQAILSVNRPVPIAIKYLFDFLDELAEKHGIEDEETLHIWKTNSLLLRFWVNTLKNPQFIFDVRMSDNVDAILAVIAQTFIDSCTISEHKVGRSRPGNDLSPPRPCRYYSDIRENTPASYQEMNSTLAELSGHYASDLNCVVALQELYNYINKYYDQVIEALEEDHVVQKMQLAYRLQQIAALVENKVTDL